MQIQIGSENKGFPLMLDTQTTGIWVPSINCTTGGCLGMLTMGSQDSTTLVPIEVGLEKWNLSYPANGSVGGKYFLDTITVAGLPSTQMVFGIADAVGSGFNGNVRPLSCKLI
jgi:Eukaryotic aspartyl protease